MLRANPNKPETWTPALERGRSEIARMQDERRDAKYMAGMRYQTCQNVPKVHFQRFLDDLGIKYNMAKREVTE